MSGWDPGAVVALVMALALAALGILALRRHW